MQKCFLYRRIFQIISEHWEYQKELKTRIFGKEYSIMKFHSNYHLISSSPINPFSNLFSTIDVIIINILSNIFHSQKMRIYVQPTGINEKSIWLGIPVPQPFLATPKAEGVSISSTPVTLYDTQLCHSTLEGKLGTFALGGHTKNSRYETSACVPLLFCL